MRGTLLVLSGPSGAGKSTVIAALLAARQNLYFSVSCTTRKPRPGETEGVDYHFLSPEEFENRIAQREFLEYAQYVGNYYGTSARIVEQKLAAGIDVLLDIEVQGAEKVRKNSPESVLVFLLPPTFGELERRLRARGTDDEDKIAGRLERAKREYREIGRYDYVVLNDRVEHAALELSAILTAEGCRISKRTHLTEGV